MAKQTKKPVPSLDEAVDYSYARPAPRIIVEAGFKGAGRYLSYEPNKNITREELQALLAAGLSVFLVWETTAKMMLRGATGGAQDSAEANRQADAIGWPADRPIYYACDFDAQGGELETINYYLKNCSGRRPGFYGHYDAVEYLAQHNGHIAHYWQCAAWSGFGLGTGGGIVSPGEDRPRRVSEHACLFQKVGYVINDTCDANVILKPDYGQFPYISDPSNITPDRKKCDVEIVKFPDNDQLWMHGYDRDGEYFTPIEKPEDIDPALEIPTRLLAAGNDDLDARFNRITGI